MRLSPETRAAGARALAAIKVHGLGAVAIRVAAEQRLPIESLLTSPFYSKARRVLFRALAERLDVGEIARICSATVEAVRGAVAERKVVRLRLPTYMVRRRGDRREDCRLYAGQCLDGAKQWQVAACPAGCSKFEAVDRVAELLHRAAGRPTEAA